MLSYERMGRGIKWNVFGLKIKILYFSFQITTGGITNKSAASFFGGIKDWCVAWWHSGREESDDGYNGYEQEEPSDLGYATPVSIETPLPSSVSRQKNL